MNIEEVLVKEDIGLCRCCHSEGNFKDLNQEYVWMDETEVYAEMLQQCFNVRILCYPGCNGINGAQQLICEDCIARLREACTFRKQVIDAERKMLNMRGLQQTGASEVSIKTEPTPEGCREADDTPEVKVKPESNEDIDIEEHGLTPQDNSDHYNDELEEPVPSSSCKRSKSETTARKRAKNETGDVKNSKATGLIMSPSSSTGKRKRGESWTEDGMRAAIKAVKRGKLTQRAASTRYKIPRRTLRDRLQMGSAEKRLGRKRVFTDEQESDLAATIKRFANIEVPLTPKFIRKQAYIFCERYAIKNNFNETQRLAGLDWLKRFLKRNPSIRQAINREPCKHTGNE